MIGSRESSPGTGDRGAVAAAGGAAGRAVRPHPVLRLALPVLRFRRLRGGRVARAEGPGRRVPGALCTELDLRADALDDRFGPDGHHSRPSISVVGPRRCCRPRRSRRCWTASASGSAGGGAEVTLEANPGPTSAATRARAGPPASRGCPSARSRCRMPELRRLGRRHAPRMCAGGPWPPATPGSRRSAWTSCTTLPGSTGPTGRRRWRQALALEPDHLSLYALTLDDPDAEGLTGPAGDHLPTTAGARRWRRAPARPRTRIAPRRSTTMPSIGSPRTAGVATRSATGRDPATRAGTTSPTGSAGHTRPSARAPMPSTA